MSQEERVYCGFSNAEVLRSVRPALSLGQLGNRLGFLSDRQRGEGGFGAILPRRNVRLAYGGLPGRPLVVIPDMAAADRTSRGSSLAERSV